MAEPAEAPAEAPAEVFSDAEEELAEEPAEETIASCNTSQIWRLSYNPTRPASTARGFNPTRPDPTRQEAG